MSFGNRNSTPDPEPEIGGIEEETLSNSQESVPLPLHTGTRKLTVRWISPIYNPRAVQKEEKVK
ncbi:MAG: hypothetical protein ACP5I4_16455 [Oceanipulchritudo sp.]